MECLIPREGFPPLEAQVLLLPEAQRGERPPSVRVLLLAIGRLRRGLLSLTSHAWVLDLLTSKASLREVLDSLCLGLEGVFAGFHCAVLLPEEEEGPLRLFSSPSLPDDLRDCLSRCMRSSEKVLEGVFEGRSVILTDPREHPWFRTAREDLDRLGFHACWLEPIRTGRGSLLGVFVVFSKVLGPEEREEISAVEIAAHFAAVAIQEKRHEQRLLQSEERYRSIFEEAPVPLWFEDFSRWHSRVEELKAAGVEDFDAWLSLHPEEVRRAARDLVVLDVNPAAVSFHEAGSREELIRSLDKTFTPVSFEVFRKELVALAEGATFFQEEGEVLTLKGEVKEVLVRLNVARSPGGLHQVFVSIVDLSHVRAAQRREAELQRKLFDKQRLEGLGLLAGGVAHDFNNLLTSILGNASLLLEEVPRGSPIRERLERIEAASMAAGDLCRQLLAYAGKGKFLVQRFDLAELVREMSGLLRVSIEARIEFDLALEEGLPLVEGDKGQIRQVVMNLITNAVEALPERRGRIRLEVRAVDLTEGERRAIWGETPPKPGPYLSLVVEDDGRGMDEETRRRLFEPFFTTKFKGRGLGMAAVKGILDAHEGAIRIETEKGMGSRFHVLLPASPGRRNGRPGKEASVP